MGGEQRSQSWRRARPGGASDPDGDAVTLTWRLDERPGGRGGGALLLPDRSQSTAFVITGHTTDTLRVDPLAEAGPLDAVAAEGSDYLGLTELDERRTP